MYLVTVVPTPRRSPNDWISVTAGGHCLAPFLGSAHRPLHDGSAVMFNWIELHGRTSFTMNADGTFSADPPLPEIRGAIICTLMGSGDVRKLVDIDCTLPGTHAVEVQAWSDNAYRYVFRAGKFHHEPRRHDARLDWTD